MNKQRNNRKPSLVSEARVALLARRAARQGQEVATEVSMNVSGEESLQSDCNSIFEHESFVEQERYVQNQSIDSIIVQNVAHECFDATQLVTDSIAAKESLLEAIGLSLGILAGTFHASTEDIRKAYHKAFADGYNSVASYIRA